MPVSKRPVPCAAPARRLQLRLHPPPFNPSPPHRAPCPPLPFHPQDKELGDPAAWESLLQVLRGLPCICFGHVQVAVLPFAIRLVRALKKSAALAARQDQLAAAVSKVHRVGAAGPGRGRAGGACAGHSQRGGRREAGAEGVCFDSLSGRAHESACLHLAASRGWQEVCATFPASTGAAPFPSSATLYSPSPSPSPPLTPSCPSAVEHPGGGHGAGQQGQGGRGR